MTDGSIKFTLIYGTIPVYSTVVGLCDIMKDISKPCPVDSGSFTVMLAKKIPSIVPKVSRFLYCMPGNFIDCLPVSKTFCAILLAIIGYSQTFLCGHGCSGQQLPC